MRLSVYPPVVLNGKHHLVGVIFSATRITIQRRPDLSVCSRRLTSKHQPALKFSSSCRRTRLGGVVALGGERAGSTKQSGHVTEDEQERRDLVSRLSTKPSRWLVGHGQDQALWVALRRAGFSPSLALSPFPPSPAPAPPFRCSHPTSLTTTETPPPGDAAAANQSSSVNQNVPTPTAASASLIPREDRTRSSSPPVDIPAPGSNSAA